MSSETPTDGPKSDRIAKLRIELKEWEHAFAKAHDGRKPTREETKKDTAIAAKYKEYSKLRSASSSKTNTLHSISTTSLKQQTQPQPSPQKTSAAPLPLAQTPTKNIVNSPWTNEIYESPLSIRRQRIFGRRDQVGPTPQKTGRVLGIFDSFIDVESTPPRPGQQEPALGTPTKKAGGDRISASPSTAKKDAGGSPFLTPRKRKLEDLKAADPFATPSAFRQWKPPPVDGELESPQVRRPPSMPKRGLSSMLKELREMENHALDEEEEVLREMEMEAASLSVPLVVKKSETKKLVFDEPELPPLPPGAFVEETLVDEDAGKDVEAPRVWKKRGLKRQHRRVIMRPVVAKPKTPGEEHDDDEQSVPSEIENGEDPVADPDKYSESGSDFKEVDDEGDLKSKRSKKVAGEDVAATAKEKKGVMEKGKEAVKKAVRKISANAHSHMNFRKLNIKNKNSKGKGRGGRFGGRRR